MTNLQKRILVAALYFPALLSSAYVTQLFALVIGILLGLSWHEYLCFFSKPQTMRDWTKHLFKIFCGVLPVFCFVFGYSILISFVFLAFVLQILIVRQLIERANFEHILDHWKPLFFGFLYLTGLYGSLVVIQIQPSGAPAIWFLLFVVAGADTGAYFVGKAWGRLPFFQHISPSKTVEGFFGGLLGAVGLAVLCQWGLSYFDYSVPSLFLVVPLALAIALGSVFGDLFESLLKRHFGVKDSGSLLPGHGGVLDRFDGVIFASLPLLFFIVLRDGFR